MRTPSKGVLLLALSTWLGATGCAPSSALAHRDEILDDLAHNAFESALDEARSTPEVYGKRNRVLYDLNVGVLAHYAAAEETDDEDRAELVRLSERAFERAERTIADLYTTRIGEEVASILTSDVSLAYEGESFERVQMHVLRALSHAALADMDEALVEVRRADLELREILRIEGAERHYRDDGLAHLVGGMLYEMDGEIDDAVVAYRAAARAYGDQVAYTRVRPPSWLAPVTAALCATRGDDLRACAPEVASWLPEGAPDPKPAPTGSFVAVVQYVGRAPRKVGRTVSLTVGQGTDYLRAHKVRTDEQREVHKALNAAQTLAGHTLTFSWPTFERVPSRARGAELALLDADTEQLVARTRTEPAQNLTAIAIKDLADRMGRIKARMVGRAVVKYVLARAVGAAAGAATKKKFVGILTQLVAGALMAVADEADTRSWFALPDAVRIARIPVRPGVYGVTARVLGARGALIEERDLGMVYVAPGVPSFVILPTLF